MLVELRSLRKSQGQFVSIPFSGFLGYVPCLVRGLTSTFQASVIASSFKRIIKNFQVLSLLYVCGFVLFCFCRCCLSACMFVHHLYTWCTERPEEDVGFPGLELQMDVSCHVGAGNRTSVL